MQIILPQPGFESRVILLCQYIELNKDCGLILLQLKLWSVLNLNENFKENF